MPTGLRHVTTPQTCPRNTAKRLRRFSVHFPWSVFTPKSPPVGGLWGGGGGVDRLSQSKMGPAPRSVSIGLPKIRPIFCGTIFGPMVFWGFWRALCNIFTRIHATTMQAITKFHRFTTDRKFGRSPKLAKIGPGDILVTNSVITESPPKMTPAPPRSQSVSTIFQVIFQSVSPVFFGFFALFWSFFVAFFCVLVFLTQCSK